MRHAHLDITRGICIALVVFGHGALGWFHPDIDHALSNVRMPLLLCLAGVYFKPALGVLQQARDKADALLKPYVVVAVVLAGYAWHRGELRTGADILDHVAHVVTFNGQDIPGWLFPAWFLALLWALHVAGAACSALTRRVGPPPHWTALPHPVRLALMGAGLVALWRLGALVLTEPVLVMLDGLCGGSGLHRAGLWLNLDLLPLGAACFILGHLGRDSWRALRPDGVQALCWSWVSAAVYLQWRPELHMLHREVHAPAASLLLACTGGLAIAHWGCWLASWRWPRELLGTMGRHSLYILLWHAPAQWASCKTLVATGILPAEAAAWLAGVAVIVSGVALGHAVQSQPWLMMWFEPLRRVARRHGAPTPVVEPSRLPSV